MVPRLNLEPTEITTRMRTLQKLLGMLIFKDGVLVVIHTPEQGEGEEAEAYEVRKRKERMLAVHPNYIESQ